MALEVYYQVKAVMDHRELAAIADGEGLTTIQAVVQCLKQNHLTPYCDESIGDHLKVKILENDNPRWLLVTAWVKDEQCENYKPKGE